MSVVNKMLNDLDARSALDDNEGAEYQEPAENKRIRYMIAFIAFVVLSAAGYFSYRTMGPAYFQELYVQAMQFINGEEPVKEQKKKVSVNSALDQMMPTRNTPSTDMASQDEQPEQSDVANQSQTEQVSLESADMVVETLVANSTQPEIDSINNSSIDNPSIDEANSTEEITEVVSSDLQIENEDNIPQALVPLSAEDISFVQFSDSGELHAEIASLNSEAADAIADNDVSKAVRAYRQILNIDQYSHDARKKLAVLHYSNNEIGAASVVLNDGIEIEPERADFRLMLARLFYKQKRLKQAYAVLAQIEPDVQSNIDFYGLKATISQELELNAESSHLYGRLVIFEPNRAQWWLGLAISLDRLGQRSGALRAYENAADLRQLSASADDFIRQRILELGG